MDKVQMIAIAQAALSAAKAEGATDAKCVVTRSQNERVTMREGKVSGYSPKTTYGVVLVVFCGAQRATVKSLASDPRAVQGLAREAVALAKWSGTHECDGVSGPKYWPCTPEAYDALLLGLENVDRLPPPSFQELKEHAQKLHDLGIAKADVVRAEAGVTYVRSTRAFATSAGFSSFDESTAWRTYVEVVGEDGGEQIAGSEGVCAYTHSKLLNPLDVVNTAYARMSARRGAVRPKSGRIPVIIGHEAAGKLIDTITEALSADAIYRKKTFLEGHIGERCFSPHLTIVDRPHVLHSPYADLIDIDGVATKDHVLIDHGVPTGWIGGYEECRKIGIEPTGHSSGCIEVFVEPGERSLSELCAQFPRVLVVTDFIGKGFDEETGDVSVGVEGYILENGERITVHEAVIAGTMFDMLKDCMLANDVERESSIHTPSIYVGEMQLSGV